MRTARGLAEKHAGVVAWLREANMDLGEYGELKVLFQHGCVPDMD